MLIFLDTEFTAFFDPMLISIGMAADSGEEFYAEVPFTDAACSAFVREAVALRLSGWGSSNGIANSPYWLPVMFDIVTGGLSRNA